MDSYDNYFYLEESNSYSFFRIPKILITDDYYKNTSTDAKLLYGLLLDRMGLSMENNWCDEDGKVFIIYTVDNISRDMSCGKNKSIKLLDELEKVNLIKRKRQGLNKPNVIFVLKFGKFKNQTSGSLENKLQEVSKSNSNKTEINKTEINKTDRLDTNNIKDNTKQSVSQFVKWLCKKYNRAVFPNEDLRNILCWCKELNLNPMSELEKSSYLNGETEKPPALSMFFKKKTYENMAVGKYRNFDLITPASSEEYRPEYKDFEE